MYLYEVYLTDGSVARFEATEHTLLNGALLIYQGGIERDQNGNPSIQDADAYFRHEGFAGFVRNQRSEADY